MKTSYLATRLAGAVTAFVAMSSLCLAQAPSIEIDFAGPPEVSALGTNRMALAVRLPKAPRIDGIIEPEIWGHASTLAPLSRVETAEPAPYATTAMVGCTSDALFIALTCAEPETARLPALEPAAHDLRVWAGDCVEILLDSTNDRRRAKGIAIGPGGALADFEIVKDQRNMSWESGAVAAVGRTPAGWTAEVMLPRSRFDNPGNDVIGFNLVRRRLGSFGAPYTWNPAPPQGIESPAWMGSLAFDTPPVSVLSVNLGLPHVGANRFLLKLRNNSAVEQRVRIGVASRPNARIADYSRYRFTLPASKTAQVALMHSIRTGGMRDFEFLLIDDGTQERIAWFRRGNVRVNESAVEFLGPQPMEDGRLGVPFRVALPRSELGDAVARVGIREAGQVPFIAETTAPLKERMGRALLTGDVAGRELVVMIMRRNELLARGVLTLGNKPEEGE